MARSALLVIYLTAYNLAQAFGWAVVLVRILQHASSKQSIDGAFDAAGDLVRFLQLSAILEVIHAITGVVPSGVLTSFLQWGGRYHWIAAIVCNVKQVQRLPSVFITFAAWSVTEVIRYPQYAVNLLGVCPWWLTWLRYSVFIPMYPIGGLCGEALLIYQALPYIKQLNLFSSIFSKLPFSYYNFVLVLVMVYPFLFLSLYIHMFKQRQRKLGQRSTGKRTSRSKRSD